MMRYARPSTSSDTLSDLIADIQLASRSALVTDFAQPR